MHVPESAEFAPQASLHAEQAVVGGESVRSDHVRTLRRAGNLRRVLVACGYQRLFRERLLAFVGVGVDEESLTGGRVLVARPDEVGFLCGQRVALRNLHLHAERFENGRLDAGVAIGLVGLHGAVAFGLFERIDEVLPVFREVFHQRSVAGALQRHHDLRIGRHVVLHGGRGLLQLRIDQNLENVAVIGDHAREAAFGDAQHVEDRLDLVQIGHRGGEDRAQRISDLARPLRLGTYHDQFVGFSLCTFFRIVQGLEGVAACCRRDDQRCDRYPEKRFHSRSIRVVFITNIRIFFQMARNFTIFAALCV